MDELIFNVTYDVLVPNFKAKVIKKPIRKRIREYYEIVNFLSSKHETVCFNYLTPDIALKRKQSIRCCSKRYDLNIRIFSSGSKVFIVRDSEVC